MLTIVLGKYKGEDQTWLEGRRKTRRLMMYNSEQRENLATCGKMRSIGLPPYSSAKVE